MPISRAFWGMVMGLTGEDGGGSGVGEMHAGKGSGSTKGPEFSWLWTLSPGHHAGDGPSTWVETLKRKEQYLKKIQGPLRSEG